MTKFEVGKYYAIHISHLSASLYKVIKRTAKTVTFDYLGKPLTFKIKTDGGWQANVGSEYVFGHDCLWANSYGKQEREEYRD